MNELLPPILDVLPGALAVTTGSSDELYYLNPACQALWHVETNTEATSLSMLMRPSVADGPCFEKLLAQRLREPLPGPGLISHLLLKDGRQVSWRTVPLLADREEGGAQLHLFEAATPSTARAIVDPHDLFRLSFDKAAVGMTLVSSDFRFLRVNPSFCRLLGYDEHQLLELRIFDVAYPGDPPQLAEWVRWVQSGEDTFHLDARFMHRQGEHVWVHLSVSVVRDAEGRPVFFIAMGEDITERKNQETLQAQRTRELLTLASTDPITGLYNHRAMQELLTHRLHQMEASGQPVSVLMLDVDHFRQLNLRYGHDAGDRALRMVADCLRRSLRGNDVACRYGGEEFLIILAGAPFAAAMQAAERIRARIEQAPPVAAYSGVLTCSIGVATFPTYASTTASLLKAADVAMYAAKNGGRNRVCGYDAGLVNSQAQELDRLSSSLQGMGLEAVNTLVTAIDLRDRYTGAHCQRVGRLATELGVHLGCSEVELEILRLGASLLDVGKIGLSDEILTKPERLTPAEWEEVRKHPIWGEQLVGRSSLPSEVARLVRTHHERLDGSGYPDGLTADELSRVARIVHVADTATALRHNRPFRGAWSRGKMIRYLQQQAGKRLDELVIQAYLDLYGNH